MRRHCVSNAKTMCQILRPSSLKTTVSPFTKETFNYLRFEIYKTLHKLNPSFMNEIFIQKSSHYHLRNSRLMKIPKTRTISHGIESLSKLGCKLWNNLPENLKNPNTLHTFKVKIKQWKDNCSCRLCRTFVAQVGFLI